MGNLTGMTRGESRWRREFRRAAGVAAVAAAFCASAASAGAQQSRGLDLGGAILPGGEEITYLRALSLLDTIRVPFFAQPFSAWSEDRLRAWAAAEGAEGNEHPWRARFVRGAENMPRRLGPWEWEVLRPELQLIYNSALPSTRNDGVVWAGRGATTVVQAGVRAKWGVVRVQLAPIGFVAQNADFELAPNGRTGLLAYGDARYPHAIDNPQRFGGASYGRVDPGESFVSLELSKFETGFSTSRLSWGPGVEQNLVFSTNAGGFPHLFVGSARPINIGIGSVNGRLIGGRLAQSPYSSAQTGIEARFTSAFVGSFTPAFWPGFEIGGMRAMQTQFRPGGPTIGEILRPLSAVISNPDLGSAPNQVRENGFASVFGRLAIPRSGVEFYAEMSRDDFAGSGRWFLLEPDDLAQLLVGVVRTVRTDGGELLVLRIEHANGEVAHHERAQRLLNAPIPPYIHGPIAQGLTSRGQILGSTAAYGGSGSVVSLDRITLDGRSTWRFERRLQLDWIAPMGPVGGSAEAETRLSLRYERLMRSGSRDLLWSVSPTRVLNRNVQTGRDKWGIEARLSWSGR